MKIMKQVCNIPAMLINAVAILCHDAKMAKGVHIHGILRLYGKGMVSIGRGTVINSRYRNNPIGGQKFTSFYTKKGAQITIGDYCGISNSALYASQSIKIGNYVKIGGDVKIYDTDFHSLDAQTRRKKDDNDFKRREVIIEDDAFIGAGSIILKGVTIGEKAIVGAGSVVTKSIPKGEVWAGNPAKFIRKVVEE